MALIQCPECNREISDKADSCPNCGVPLEKFIPVESTTATDLNKKACPFCKSDNIQTIKMAVMSGTTVGNSTAIGVTGHLDVGLAKIGSRSQTTLVASLIPGNKPKQYGKATYRFFAVVFLMVAAGSGYACFNIYTKSVLSRSMTGGYCLAFSAISLLSLFASWAMISDQTSNFLKQTIGIWEQKNKHFETGWICHKCGGTWIPEN